MLLGDAVLSSSPLSSLGVSPALGSASVVLEEFDVAPRYASDVRVDEQYQGTLTAEEE